MMEAAGRVYITYPSRSDWFTIYCLSDLHYGNKATAVDAIRRDIDKIRADPYALWIGGGDYAEYISFRDRRFDANTITRELEVADLGRLGQVLTDRVRDMFVPIKDKCLGLVYGNHENNYARENDQQQLHGLMCKELGVKNLGYSALLDVSFTRVSRRGAPRVWYGKPDQRQTTSYRIFIHHGAGCAGTPGGKLNRLIQFMHAFDADLFFIGHVHDRKGQRLTKIGADAKCGKIVAKETLGVVSGSYLRTYAQGVTTYGEVKGYAPVCLGPSFIQVRPHTREMKGEV